MEKQFIQAKELLEDSFKLAWQVYESGYRPNYIIGVWRGGAPIGIAVQEFLEVLGVHSDHIAIRTSYYSGIDQRNKEVQIYGLNYVIRKLESEDFQSLMSFEAFVGSSSSFIYSQNENPLENPISLTKNLFA